jgi:hypothetical protein
MFNARIARTAALASAALLVVVGVASTLAIDDSAFAHSAFGRTWNRTDKPIEDGQVSRSWI